MLSTLSKNNLITHQPVNHKQNSSQFKMQQFEMSLSVVKAVSFDLFDTLLQRNNFFTPKDLFYQVQELAAIKLGLQLDNFTTLRIRAEEISRIKAYGHGIEETSLDKIYIELQRITNLADDAILNLKEIELDSERLALSPLESGKCLFKKALATGKPVVIVSDTYFDEEFIVEIVNKNGYGSAKNIYVSSSYGKTKIEGSLYDIVLIDLQCRPRELLHVGDNQLSDVSIPLSKGIRALFSPTLKQKLKWKYGLRDHPCGNLTISSLLCDLSNKSVLKAKKGSPHSTLEQTGIQHFSFLYLSHTIWLIEQLQKTGCKRVYFAARDGLIMKRFFDLIAASVGFEIDSHYLFVSRIALYPSLIFIDPEQARQVLCQTWDHLTINNALRRISLNPEECFDLLSKHGLTNLNLPLDDRDTKSRFLAFLNEAWPLLELKNKNSYDVLVKYLRQEKLLTGERAAFVDIGWHGSLQNILVKLINYLGIRNNLKGYYLGTFEKPLNAAKEFSAKGFLVDNSEPKQILNLIRCSPSLIELFHTAEHGTVLGYKQSGEQIVPILEDNPKERKQFIKSIEPVQNSAYNFIKEQLKYQQVTIGNTPNPELIARTALKVIYDPTLAEASTFGHLQIATDFGGQMKSITGTSEWDIKEIKGERLPDGTIPMWRPGFRVLQNG